MFLSHHFPHTPKHLMHHQPPPIPPTGPEKKYFPRELEITAERLAFQLQTERLLHQSRCRPHKPFPLHTALGGEGSLHANKPHQFINQNEFMH